MTAPIEPGSRVPPQMLGGLDMGHPLDFSIDEIRELGIELFAVERSEMLDGAVEALSTDCGNTLSTIACDCINTLSTLFCLSCTGGSG